MFGFPTTMPNELQFYTGGEFTIHVPKCDFVYMLAAVAAVAVALASQEPMRPIVRRGGGGSGAICTLLIPRRFLPEAIHLSCGAGGASAAAGGATIVSFLRESSAAHSRILTANGGGAGGTGGAQRLAQQALEEQRLLAPALASDVFTGSSKRSPE